ncbi:ferric reduction oxidase 8, mitochondrial [Carica papaya]|uniref:ferric reduction oxidase 8, mitochondrial n=1 Tax=Carica papaya TaxID=3649 RepID=UPI000B8D15B6|nr:ferric reduction oxidase 8, mitochondrial [Carica papaya]
MQIVTNMAKTTLRVLLKAFIILICAGWVSLWLLKPTNLWIRKWHGAEDRASSTIFGYYGLNFAVYAFPGIALAITGLFYLSLQPVETRRRQARSSATAFSNPVVVNSFVGILSSLEILAIVSILVFLAWTFYARISNDFEKLMPIKSMKLNLWQLKYLRVATRFGLLAEACLALLLLPILRGLAVFQLVGIQFESSVRYHIWLGSAMIFFATFHGASTLFVWGISHHIQDEIWKWQKTGRIYLAGEIALVSGLVMWITSLPQIRRKKFEIFYYTHHLYIIFLTFFLLHAGDRHFYWVFPGIFLFGLDKLLRIIQSRPGTCVLAARIFPCKAIELILPKDSSLKYTPSSIIFMKVPSISKFQWHSFSISSSSVVDSQTMSVLIKCEGRWTSSLYNMIQAKLDADQVKCMPIAIEGPYGPSSLNFLRYDSLVLVAGGIGITPFLSILLEIASPKSSNRCILPTRVELIYVVRSSQEICLLNSVSSLLLKQESEKLYLKLKVFVTQEKQSTSTIEELLEKSLSQIQMVNLETDGSSYAVHGVEGLPWMAALIGISSIVFLGILICLNRMLIPSGKKDVKRKSPSWIADVVIISSFIIAICCSTLVAIVLRWRRLNKGIMRVTQKQGKSGEEKWKNSVEEHEIHFGRRPNFVEEILDAFVNKSGRGCNVGVVVCGPESMKQSIALICQQKCPSLEKQYLGFHSLNFTI